MSDPIAPYQDSSLSVDQRTEDLLGRLPLTDKVGLMFHTMAVPAGVDEVVPLFGERTLRSLLDRGLRHFNILGSLADGRAFAQWHNSVQRAALAKPLGIPVTFSTDPRHHFGDNPLTQMMAGPFSQWPETLGLAAIGSGERVREFADIVRREYVAAGIRVALHPQLDLATEPRWSRINTTFGEDAELASHLGVAYVLGLQGDSLGPESVAAMIKHFPGGGPQQDGNDPHFAWGREQVYPGGNADYHLRPFLAALDAGAAEVMPYYGMPVGTDWDEVGFGFNKSVITGVLREQLGFDGIVCTDWGLITDHPDLGDLGVARAWGVEHLDPPDRVVRVLEAGVDQFGGEDCTEVLLSVIRAGRITEARIDESVRRILRVPFELGLFDRPFIDEETAAVTVGRSDFREAGLKAQRDSLTLLTNSEALPLTRGMTVFAPELSSLHGYGEKVDSPADADVAVLRLKAPFEPRSEGMAALFHHGSLEFDAEEVRRVLDICEQVPTVLDVYLDRPAVLTPFVAAAAAIVVNFGVSETALLDVLFGQAAPLGTLPFDLPRSDAEVAASRTDVPFDTADPLFRFGHGLRYPKR
ncbi:glycoside hydrolase family 3 N-terminal domain-containing protein [Mycobacterium sp. M26]|uniref:glycoside hydrolase family 3 protein n=1 Tax=Mycobacterium sp. M26 TaxID=1762962 RepID=UPI00073E3A18|nr:glycoside hydrolase family 3 N-terminal domain-containing protein [Mycobacterium sp. M26]